MGAINRKAFPPPRGGKEGMDTVLALTALALALAILVREIRMRR